MDTHNDKSNSIVVTGFGVVIILMFVLVGSCLYLLNSSNQNLNTIVHINNQKIEYASSMRDAIRLRQISMNSMLTMTGIDEMDSELMRFYNYARPYREAREKLLAMPIDDYERELHEQLTRQVRIAQPINQEAAENLGVGVPLEISLPLVKHAQKEQNTLLVLLDSLVLLQKEYAEIAVNNENKAFNQSSQLIIIAGLLLFIGAILIAKYVSKYVSKRNKLMINACYQADEATSAKSKFLSQMSHELRTPMNAILGFSELIYEDENLTNDQKKFIGDIRKSGYHLLELINQVLDLSKIESSKVDITMESVPLCNLLQECRKLSMQLAETRNVTLYMGDMACKDKFIYADKLRLKQVILNLVSNAIKYNNEGGLVAVQCELTENDKYRISVTDTGSGIPEHKINQLFKPFNRLGAENSKIEGTGIGLVITKNLVEIMGGSIGVHSAEAGGSVFWIEMRRGQFIPDHVEKTDEEEPIIQNQENIDDTKTLLYVEDNIENTRVMKHFIKKIGGYRLLNAVTAERGILMAKSYHPDLILMDINLPGMDGFAALSELQELNQTTNVPIVVVSANVMPSDIKKAMDAGFTEYITKPIDFKKLKNILNYYCPTSTMPSLEIVVNQE